MGSLPHRTHIQKKEVGLIVAMFFHEVKKKEKEKHLYLLRFSDRHL